MRDAITLDYLARYPFLRFVSQSRGRTTHTSGGATCNLSDNCPPWWRNIGITAAYIKNLSMRAKLNVIREALARAQSQLELLKMEDAAGLSFLPNLDGLAALKETSWR